MGILDIIQQHDAERDAYIAQLESEIRKLRIEKAEAVQLAVRGVQIHEASMLKLIMSGALNKPQAKTGTNE